MLVSKAPNTMFSAEEHKRIPSQHFEGPRSVGVAQEEADSLQDVPTKEQARIYRKVDWRLTPMLMLLYFFANLDRFVFTPPKLPPCLLMPNFTNIFPVESQYWKCKDPGTGS